MGTGPFKFSEIEPNVKTILVRNDDYWGPKPKLESILFRPLEDPATRVNALEVGEVHIIDEPPFDLIEEMQERGFVLAINPSTVSHYFITLNMKSPKLQTCAFARRSTWRSTVKRSHATSTWAPRSRPGAC